MQLDNEKILINLIERRKVFWEPIVAAALLLLAILGVMVPLYVHSDNANRAQIAAMDKSAQKQIEAIREDIKEFHRETRDFHDRLCEIESKRTVRD